MMDKNHILANGILEQYLLGELSTEEQLQVETVLQSDAELKSYYDKLELSFETLAFENSISLPQHTKDMLIEKAINSKIKVLQLSTNTNKFYVGLAASVAILAAVTSIWMYSQFKTQQKDLEIVKEENIELKQDINSLEFKMDETKKWLDIINSPDTQQYILVGNALSPNSKVVSYVNHSSKSVVINTKNLQTLDAEHDYQMWADVDGEMINMGVIPKNSDLLAMTYIDHAESLNITIEPAGGNDHPTVSRLVTNIYLTP